MDLIAQLIACATSISSDLQTFVTACQNELSQGDGKATKLPQDTSAGLRKTKQSLLANIVKLHRIIMGPKDLLEQLACQVRRLLFDRCTFSSQTMLDEIQRAAKRDSQIC